MTEPVSRPPEKLRLDFLASHTVYKNAAGKRIPGVTTVLNLLAKPALLYWAWGEGAAGRKLDASRQVAADIGTVAHGLCAAHLRGILLDTENVTPEVMAKAETSFLRFLQWFDSAGLTVVATEVQLVSERMQVGGTADFVGRTQDGDLWLADLKTGKALYDEMYLQAATYAAMWEEAKQDKIARVYLVRIPKEDTDQLEVKEVLQRMERVAAFTALAETRRLLQKAGVKV